MLERRQLPAGWHCFDVRWFDEPLSTFRTPNTLPVTTSKWYEQREAARFSLYTWTEYQQLPADERAAVIAYYRVHNKLTALIDNHQAQQAELESKRHASKMGRKR